MNLAPTEKHLEDWIINNIGDFADQSRIVIHRLIGRQLFAPSGRTDLVFAGSLCIWVAEIKKGIIDGEAVSQVLHYLSDARDAYDYLQSTYGADDPHHHSKDAHTDYAMRPVHGLLVGSAITRHAALACLGANICFAQYQYVDGEYLFSTGIPDNFAEINNDLHPDIINGLKEVMRHMHIYEESPHDLKRLYVAEGWIEE